MQIAKTDFGTYKLALIGRPWAKLPWPVGKEKQTLSISMGGIQMKDAHQPLCRLDHVHLPPYQKLTANPQPDHALRDLEEGDGAQAFGQT